MAATSKKPSHDSLVDLDQIRELIDLLIEKDVSEFAIERDGVRVEIRRGGVEINAAVAPVQLVPAPPAAIPASEAAGVGGEADVAVEAGYEDCFILTSPMVGTFYRSAEPDADPFTEVGDDVSEGQTLCIVEAMKLMNEIVADAGGEVVAIFADNAEPVEFGQRLFAIRSSE